jgi:hypothetical protein
MVLVMVCLFVFLMSGARGGSSNQINKANKSR